MTSHSHLKVGDKVPSVFFKTRVGDAPVCGSSNGHWQDLSSAEIFEGKRVIIFALPGAFTPTCSSTHLPGYEAAFAELQKLGIDDVYCLSVNDAFVMNQWGLSLGARHVKLLPDGNLDFTRGMGMQVTKHNLGFGDRSWRYSMVVKDGVIEKLFVEPGMSNECATDPFEVSDVNTMLAYLQG